MKPLEHKDIINILNFAIKDKERGLGNYNIQISDSALDHLANIANGDARTALNALELAVLTTPPSKGDNMITINLEIAQEPCSRRAIVYEKMGTTILILFLLSLKAFVVQMLMLLYTG